MSRFASAVHLVTTEGRAGRRGVTATAVVGVSDDPATILVCLNASNAENARFAENGNFAVNVLAAGGRELAEAFAGGGKLPQDERFALGRWTALATGAPVLEQALVAFDCRLVEARMVATHHVLVGEVAAVHEGPSGPPLLYHARGYHLL
ncbi:flavin reductase [Aureimonas leprariae]|uniref:Flavin reductase n=2 Tax=Plantimonas leprariae TaxID=2615207 RepID=A0A7V7PR74_9HYPH|nr:flavin reductase [Aureimonas leprariae]